MPESSQHKKLVQAMHNWVADTQFGGDSGYIFVDSDERHAQANPPRVYGFVPDLFARKDSASGIVIGEAETSRSLVSQHTRDQFAAFLSRCSEEEDSLFVVAVPWISTRLAKAILSDIQHRRDMCRAEVVVLEQLGA